MTRFFLSYRRDDSAGFAGRHTGQVTPAGIRFTLKKSGGYRYSNTLGWNTFPVPLLTEQNKADLTRCAENILLAREVHFPATIADLYDPEAMPENLRHAHERNDEVLERIYIGRRFRNDTERLEELFELYTKMTAAAAKAPVKKATRGKKA